MTPLAFRLLDGIGETPAVAGLPLAFAVADLRPTTGWKSQIEAAERLTRARALDVNRLLALYTEGRPSASGGVWDRAAAIQKLDAAILASDATAVGAALPAAASLMRDAGLTVPFADLYGERLSQIMLDGPAATSALRFGLLSPAYEAIAARATPATAREDFAVAVALGTLGEVTFDETSDDATLMQAVYDGMTGPPPAHLIDLAKDGRLGESLLMASILLAGRTETDPQDIADALAFFRSVGLLDVARRTALQLLLT